MRGERGDDGKDEPECGLTVYMSLLPFHVVGKAGQGACELMHNEVRVSMPTGASAVTFLNSVWSCVWERTVKLEIGWDVRELVGRPAFHQVHSRS